MSTLLLRLAAPLQAWGTDSKFEIRRTGREPSKSGVTGILAAALGIKRDGDLSRLNSLRFGVRIDREGSLLRDYHTASIDGVTTDYITNRYYLADAVFLVGLESKDEELLSELDYALSHPAFPLFLGRRSCPPTLPLSLGIRESDLEESFRREPLLTQRPKDSASFRVRIDCNPDDEGAVRTGDLPLSFDPACRKYGLRTVKETAVVVLQ